MSTESGAIYGDEHAIYLPDGSTIIAYDVINLPQVTSKRPPVVVLVSCNTGRANVEGVITIAQALLYTGRAAAVLAPTTEIAATPKVINFLRTMYSSANGQVGNALKDIKGPWQLFVQVEPEGGMGSGEDRRSKRG